MDLHYLKEEELELSRDEVNQIIALRIFLRPITTDPKQWIIDLLDDVREHEGHIRSKVQRDEASQEIQQTLGYLKEMDVLYAELRKIPWYRISERKTVKQKIKELRIKTRWW